MIEHTTKQKDRKIKKYVLIKVNYRSDTFPFYIHIIYTILFYIHNSGFYLTDDIFSAAFCNLIKKINFIYIKLKTFINIKNYKFS